MNFKKRSLIISLAVISFLILSSMIAVGLVKTNNRDGFEFTLDEEMTRKIAEDTEGMNCREIVRYGLKATSKALNFSEKNDLNNGSANCVGYAQMCSSICNYAFTLNNSSFRARPVVGYVTFCGINLCWILHSLSPRRYNGFVKDHDFVEIDLGQGTLYFDPCLYDFHINATTFIRK